MTGKAGCHAVGLYRHAAEYFPPTQSYFTRWVVAGQELPETERLKG
jgi:hypothetical protein